MSPGTLRLFIPAVIGWVFAAWAIGQPGAAAVVLWGTVVFIVGLAVAWTVPGWRVAALSLLQLTAVSAAVVLLIAASIDRSEWARNAPSLTSGTKEMLSVQLTGFATPLTGERFWAPAQISTERGTVPVMLWADGAAPTEWVPGLTVEVEGKLDPQPPASSSAFGVHVSAVKSHADPAPYQHVIAELRTGLIEAAEAVPGAELVPGFAVGDTRLVNDALDTAMKATSLTHLTAVSGANCALIVAAAMGGFAYLGAGLRVRLIIGAVSLGSFVLLIGPDPSVERAALMAVVTLVSRFGGRKAIGFASLGLAMVVMLITDPWQARHPGFTLSVAATAGILMFARPLSSWCVGRLRLPSVVALPLAVTIAAQITCGPLLLLLQPGVPVGGIPANLLAAPAAPLGTGLGLIAMLLLAIHPHSGMLVTLVASLPSRWVSLLAVTIAALPFTSVHWISGAGGAVLLTITEFAFIVALYVGRHRRRAPWQTRSVLPRRLSYLWWGSCGVGVGVALSMTVALPVTERLSTPHDWVVAMCDVGQGDAVLLRDPEHPGEVMLTDTGDDPELLARCLDRFGVQRIELLVLSHDDRDHVGALATVIEQTAAAVIAPELHGSETDREVLASLTRTGVPTRSVSAGDSGVLGQGRTVWRVLSPETGAAHSDANAASIVMEVRVGELTILLLGDTGRAEHTWLRHQHTALGADIVKVAHHGSRNQDGELLQQLDASLALISSGSENRYGHPSDDVLRDLDRAGTRALRTDLQGSIAVSMRESALVVWSER